MYFRLGILAILAISCSSPLLFAQSQPCANTDSSSNVPTQKTRITIVGVEFQSENPLSDAQREEYAKLIQQQDLWTTTEESDSSWVNQALNSMRDALRERGYFRTNVEGTPYLVLAQPSERRYMLAVTIESGPQYRLGHVRFASASNSSLVFPEALLRQQVQPQEGDLFDVTKIRGGLEAIGRLYGSKGYIDATPEPETTIDEKNSLIDLLIKVDEQKPYRIARLEFVGLHAKTRNELTPPQQIGDFFNPALWRTFFKDNMTRLPPGSSPERNMPVSRDAVNGTVDIMLDFRQCPKSERVD